MNILSNSQVIIFLAYFALIASAFEFGDDEISEKFSSVHRAKLMSKAKPGQPPGISGITPGKIPKFCLNRCAPCWAALKKLLKKHASKIYDEEVDMDEFQEDEPEIYQDPKSRREPLGYYRYGAYYPLSYKGYYHRF